VIREQSGEEKELDLESGTYVLGRSEDNEIVLEDTHVSREHAKFIIDTEKETFVLEDLKSTNGVFVNKNRIKEKTQLQEGDIIKIGETKIDVKSTVEFKPVVEVEDPIEEEMLPDQTVMIKPPRMIALEKAGKVYKLGKVEVTALKSVDLEVDEGEFISVCGPSGSGKSTLLNLIGCIDIPTSGKVSIMGKDVTSFNDAGLSRLRNKAIGFIFQSFNLIPVLNAFENVEYPLVVLGETKSKRLGKVATIMREVGLADYAKHRPDELSGGQRQRVAIARALVTEPKMVLADEPTANLDSVTGIEILDLMQKMNEEHKTTFVFSTHDPKIEKYAKKIYKMKDGNLSC
jgi:putative ABC transport system ATP-binding protein